MIPSSAVTVTVIVFFPTDKDFEPRSSAEIVAVPSFFVADTVVLFTSLATLAV
ncbi:hypothetical protein D3C76_1800530 [compost metagenome]